MKTLTTLCTLILSCSLMAENNGQQANQGFLNAAKEYDTKAKRAANNGKPKNAEIFTRLAAIKREAAVSTNGYDWAEYHKLTGQLKHTKGNKTKKGKPADTKAPEPKPEAKKAPVKKPPTDLIGTAQKHAALANKASAADDNYAAQIHTRLAAILIDSAAKQSENRAIDWTEYNDLKGLLDK
jgi:hypothetical protein